MSRPQNFGPFEVSKPPSLNSHWFHFTRLRSSIQYYRSSSGQVSSFRKSKTLTPSNNLTPATSLGCLHCVHCDSVTTIHEETKSIPSFFRLVSTLLPFVPPFLVIVREEDSSPTNLYTGTSCVSGFECKSFINFVIPSSFIVWDSVTKSLNSYVGLVDPPNKFGPTSRSRKLEDQVVQTSVQTLNVHTTPGSSRGRRRPDS